MNYLKVFGLLAVAAAALMAFAGTASAYFTSPAGTAYAGNIIASSTNSEIEGPVNIWCLNSTIEWDPVTAGGTIGEVDVLTFTNCSRSVSVTNKGIISVSSNGEVVLTGARVTVQTTILGFPAHCIYETGGRLGFLTEGVAPAKIHVGSNPMLPLPTSSLCGNFAEWRGTYTVSTPASAITVD